MPNYQYSAVDAEGRPVTGRITEASMADARRVLEQRGLTVDALVAAESHDEPAQPLEALSEREALELSQHLVHLSATQTPLAAGFRAAAEESGNRRLAAALRRIAVQIEQGKTLDAVLRESSTWLPQPIFGVITAAAQSGNLAAALADLVEHHRSAQVLRRRIFDSFAYPFVLTGVSASVILLLLYGASSAFERIFVDFSIHLPLTTRLLFWWRDVGVWLVLGAFVAAMAAAFVYRRWRGEAAWMRLAASIPLFGPLSYWLGIAEWCSLMNVLTKYRVSLPEALRLCSAGVGHASLRELSRDLAVGVSGGQSLAHLLAADRRVPPSLVPLVSWGERAGTLTDAFAAVGEMFARRVQVRAAMLQAIAPPALFIAIGCFVLMVVGGLFQPLLSLLQGLS